ncbi:MAG: SpoIID/LytB domain-containing protein [Chitinivibrionales bacterium]
MVSKRNLILVGLLLMTGCAGQRFIRPSVPKDTHEEESLSPEAKDTTETEGKRDRPEESLRISEEAEAEEEQELADFALAFDDLRPVAGSGKRVEVRTEMVRIILLSGNSSYKVLSENPLAVKMGKGKRSRTVGNTVKIEHISDRYIMLKREKGKLFRVSLPCTLTTGNSNSVMIRGKKYRGAVIFDYVKGRGLSLINYLRVEDYLRGVVPLEIGSCRQEFMEALKAQAVAARTYTYRRIQSRQEKEWDLLPGVEDQVYGGIPGEQRVSDEAVSLTKNQVMLHSDTLVNAYYHSTCGGSTADISNVWRKSSDIPYLKSIEDTDKKGRCYCSESKQFKWREVWSIAEFSSLVNRYSRKTFKGSNTVYGRVKGIEILSRYGCGRVKECSIITSKGRYSFGGDKIRFVIRRLARGNPILRSSLITGASVTKNSVIITGRGYGHGIGMCQTGALKRALKGQAFLDILKAYYTGVRISEAVSE